MKNIFIIFFIFNLCSLNAFASNIEKPKILFEENFDFGITPFIQKILNFSEVKVIDGVGMNGTSALEVTYIGYKKGSKRIYRKIPLNGSTKQATLFFDVFFSKDFQWTLGGKLHGLGPKEPIGGGKKRKPESWSARILFKPNGRCAYYIYDQNIKKKWGTSNTNINTVFVRNKWHNVIMQLCLNDPEANNGSIMIYVDGKLAIGSQNINFRGIGGSQTLIQSFLFCTFHGGNTINYAPTDKDGNPTVVHAYFDNFMIVDGLIKN